jgi:hypothetical protein
MSIVTTPRRAETKNLRNIPTIVLPEYTSSPLLPSVELLLLVVVGVYFILLNESISRAKRPVRKDRGVKIIVMRVKPMARRERSLASRASLMLACANSVLPWASFMLASVRLRFNLFWITCSIRSASLSIFFCSLAILDDCLLRLSNFCPSLDNAGAKL